MTRNTETAKKRKARDFRRRTIPFLFMLSVAFLFAILLYRQDKKIEAKKEGYENTLIIWEEKLEEAEKEEAELEEEKTYRQTKAFIIDEAHRKFGLVMPGEIVLKPSDE